MHEERGPDVDGRVEACPPEPLVWSVRPCARNRWLAAAVGLFVLAMSLAVQVLFGSPWWGALALVLLGLSVAPYYLGATYTVAAEGASAAGPFGTHRRTWGELRGCFADADGVLLSPFAKPSRLAYTRGLYLRFADNRDEVMACVERCMEQAARESRATDAAHRPDG